MKEIGKVTQIDEGDATIIIQRSSSCASCNACSMGKNQNEMILKVSNELGATPGDWVELDLESISILKASAIAYIIPLIALLLGVAGGYGLAGKFSLNPEFLGALGGILLTALSFLGIKLMEPILNKKGDYSPKMISIINTSWKGEDRDGK